MDGTGLGGSPKILTLIFKYLVGLSEETGAENITGQNVSTFEQLSY